MLPPNKMRGNGVFSLEYEQIELWQIIYKTT